MDFLRNLSSYLVLLLFTGYCYGLSVLTLQSNETGLNEDGWGPWGRWGPCSRTCGGGVTFMQRKCLNVRQNGNDECIGQSRKYSSCYIQDCPYGSIDFRAEQCSVFNNQSFVGRRHTWKPYVGSSVSNPCQLHCQPEEEVFFLKMLDKVVDGTRCRADSFDVCVDGTCQEVGCDMMLGSGLREDVCRECGGDGSSCYRVHGVFNTARLPTGYTTFLEVPASATNIEIAENGPSRNYLAVKDAQGSYLVNGGWQINHSRTFRVAGTTLTYRRKPYRMRSPETLTSLGPTMEKLLIDVIVQEPNKEIRYSYHLPLGVTPNVIPGNLPVTTEITWKVGNWSVCSHQCGGGTQRRRVRCYRGQDHVRGRLCKITPRPVGRRRCNEQSCPRWWSGQWGVCSVSCNGGIRTREVQCLQDNRTRVADASCLGNKPTNQERCNEVACPYWSDGEWTQCSAECGTGMQSRRVECLVLRNGLKTVLPDENCGGEKPKAQKHCLGPPCQISWFYGSWSSCTTSCGGGERTRHVMCLSEVTFRPAENCINLRKPPTAEPCNTQDCPESASAVRSNNCRLTEHGCCNDETQPASGPNHFGCPEYDVCYVTMDRGSLCGSWVSRWFFNPVTSQCQHFWYGGCHGNRNRYDSQNECKAVCDVTKAKTTTDQTRTIPSSQPTTATQPTRTTRTYIQPTTRGPPTTKRQLTAAQTTRRQPTAAQTTRRTLVFLSDSTTPQSKISRLPLRHVTEAFSLNVRTLDVAKHSRQPKFCSMQTERGPCFGRFERWFYDEIDHACKSFTFGGCAGNENNFGTREFCEAVCVRSHRPVAKAGWLRMLPRHTSIKVKLGATARLACPAIGSPPPVIRWLKSGRELHFNNSRISRRSNDLIISNVKSSDVGRYACVASNSASREKRLNLRLIITGRIIRFRVKPQNTTVTKGRQVKLRCRVRGGPATISWSKDGDPIHTDNHYVVKSWGDLRILRSQISDSGNYSCMVSTKGNKLATLQASAVVKVLPKPTTEECKDLPFYANCRLVAAASMCRHQHYKRYCCVTCKQKKLLS